MVVKLFVDLRSQPCRSLFIFLKSTSIEFEVKSIDLFKGEQKQDEYLAVNRLGAVPGIQDGEFGLGETVAIVRYLATKYADQVPDHWYPKDVEKRARVDEYLAWHHGGTRKANLDVFINEFVGPRMKLPNMPTPPEEKIKKDADTLNSTLDKIENVFLRDNKYLTGDEISIADVMAVSELVQIIVTVRDITEGRPKLKAFVERVKERTNPVFDEANAALVAWEKSV